MEINLSNIVMRMKHQVDNFRPDNRKIVLEGRELEALFLYIAYMFGEVSLDRRDEIRDRVEKQITRRMFLSGEISELELLASVGSVEDG